METAGSEQVVWNCCFLQLLLDYIFFIDVQFIT